MAYSFLGLSHCCPGFSNGSLHVLRPSNDCAAQRRLPFATASRCAAGPLARKRCQPTQGDRQRFVETLCYIEPSIAIARKMKHIVTRPDIPRTNGKAERFSQTLLRKWAFAFVYPSSNPGCITTTSSALTLPSLTALSSSDARLTVFSLGELRRAMIAPAASGCS